MSFEARMGKTPEGYMQRREAKSREKVPLDEIVNEYTAPVTGMLEGRDATTVKDELSRFAKDLTEAREGVEQDELTDRLFNALRMRKIEIPEWIDTKRERAAFGLALARGYIRSLQ